MRAARTGPPPGRCSNLGSRCPRPSGQRAVQDIHREDPEVPVATRDRRQLAPENAVSVSAALRYSFSLQAFHGVLPAGQERGRAGSLPGPVRAGVVRAHHPVHARARLAAHDQNHRRKRGIGVRDAVIGYPARDPPALDQPGAPAQSRSQYVCSWSYRQHRRQHQARLSHDKRRSRPLS